MSVRKRKWKTKTGQEKEAWIVDYHADGQRHIETFERKKDADVRHSEIRVDIKAGVHLAPSKCPTVAEAGHEWIRGAELGSGGRDAPLERSTVKQYKEHLRLHIAPLIGSLKLSDVSISVVRNFEGKLRDKGRSPKMVRMILTSLGAILADAGERGQSARNAVHEMRRSRKKKGRNSRQQRSLKVGVDIPSPQEIGAIFGAAKPHWRPLFITAAFTGLRASELRGLIWANVDLKANELHVVQRADVFNEIGAPKSAKGRRTVPFGSFVANTLKAHRLTLGGCDLVFPNTKGKIDRLTNIIQRGLIPTVEAAGLVDATGKAKYTGMHLFRHFYASWCIDRGLPPKVIQERLGHASITMTYDRYGHLFPKGNDSEELEAAELAVVNATQTQHAG
jgi:integrase